MNRSQITNQLGEIIKKLIVFAAFHVMIYVLPTSAQQNLLSLRGEIKDQRGAIITNAEVRLIDETGTVRKTTGTNQGAFRFENLSNGSYTLQISAEGFSEHEEKIQLSTATTKLDDISIVLYPDVRADVVVSANSEAPLDVERAAGTLTLSAKSLENLPDDPDQLSQQLQNLAASSGSIPGQATVTVDGFLGGGNLPPKSSIRSVKINPNLYSAEYDTPPTKGGRIEILTKPGVGAFTGTTFFSYNGTILNARDPLAARRTDTSTNRYGFNLGMPVIKKRLGLFVDFERRAINEPATVNAIVLDKNFQASSFTASLPAPRQLSIGAARTDWQVNANHTIVFRYDFNRNKLINQGVGGVNLPERGFDSFQNENSFRLTETAVLNPRTVNELRFGFTGNSIEQKAAASGSPIIIVAGSFTSGGASVQSLSRHERRLELTDYLTTDVGQYNLKFGVQLYNKNTVELRADNTNGSFFFGGANLLNSVAGPTFISGLEQYRRTLLNLPGGTPTQFSVSFGAPRVAVNQWIFASFAQAEWRLSPKVSMSAGLRYEAQNAPDDFLNFAPRLGLAYAPGKKQHWTFRVRTGLFYERFSSDLILETERLDGTNQRQIIMDAPSFPNPFIGGNTNTGIPTTRILAVRLDAPATFQSQIEMERRFAHGWNVSASYSLTRGWNNLRSRNINAPIVTLENTDFRTAPRPFGAIENILQFETSGNISGRVLYVGLNQNASNLFSINAGYLHFDFMSDGDSAQALPQSSYDLAAEWARPVWQARHRFFAYTTFNLPSKLFLSASVNASSGTPYNITTGRDNNGDGNFNDRPGLDNPANLSAIGTSFGFLNANVTGGDLPRNAGTNPAFFALDLNLNRQFVLGRKNDQGENRYKLTLNVRASNILNRSNLYGTVGVLSSPFFGRAIAARPARRIEFGLRLNF